MVGLLMAEAQTNRKSMRSSLVDTGTRRHTNGPGPGTGTRDRTSGIQMEGHNWHHKFQQIQTTP